MRIFIVDSRYKKTSVIASFAHVLRMYGRKPTMTNDAMNVYNISNNIYFEIQEHPFNRAPFYLSILTDILNSLVRLLLLRHYPDSEDEFLDFFISLGLLVDIGIAKLHMYAWNCHQPSMCLF